MKVVYSKKAQKQLDKLDKSIHNRIDSYMQRVADANDPRKLGKALSDNLKGYWRYRVGDYRVICEIHDDELIISVIKIAHRRTVYADN